MLINANAAKPNMMYAKSGAQAPDDPRAIIVEEKGNGAQRSNVYETADGGGTWEKLSRPTNATPDTEPPTAL